MATAAVKRHWARLIRDGCIITGGPATIAHCHGGSIIERMGEKAKGKKLPRMDWLALPLHPRLHFDTSPGGLDRCVAEWEAENGTQAMHLDTICARYDIDVWALAAPTKIMLPRRWLPVVELVAS